MSETNAFVQQRYDELMREGKHGHYETMFRVVREAIDMNQSNREIDILLTHWAHELGAKDGDDCATVITDGISRLQRDAERYCYQLDALLAHCPDPECGICAEIICPHKSAWHFHHDGCPACAEVDAVSVLLPDNAEAK